MDKFQILKTMIQFFRRIRQNLIMDKPSSANPLAGNKVDSSLKSSVNTWKYLKYAIGEIVLVMIGILLALQVNNWNNHRLEGSKEQMFLKNLQADFKTSLNELNRNYNSCFGAYQASLKLLEIIKEDSAIDPTHIDSVIGEVINISFSVDLNSSSKMK